MPAASVLVTRHFHQPFCAVSMVAVEPEATLPTRPLARSKKQWLLDPRSMAAQVRSAALSHTQKV